MNKSLLIALTALFLSACSYSTKYKDTINDQKLKLLVKQKKYTIIYFWTNWCGVSEYLIKDTYLPLIDTLNKTNKNIQVLLIYSSGLDNDIYKELEHTNSDNNFVMEKCGNGNPLIDRYKIKSFLSDILNKSHIDTITRNKNNFSIPVSILVDSNLNIIEHHVGSDTKIIMNRLSYYN